MRFPLPLAGAFTGLAVVAALALLQLLEHNRLLEVGLKELEIAGPAALAATLAALACAAAAAIGRLTCQNRALAATARELERDLAARSWEEARGRSILAALLRASGEGVALLDGELRLTFVSARWAGLVGCGPPRAVSGRRVEEVLPEAVRAACLALLEDLREGRAGEAILPCPREAADSREARPARIGLALLSLPDGPQPERYVILCRPLGPGERAAPAPRPEADFLAMMGHELRTPLNVVQGYVDLLGAQSGLTATQRRYVEAAGAATASLCTIVDDVVDLARIEGGLVQLDPRGFALHALTAELRMLLRHAGGAEIEVEIDPAVAPRRRGDPDRLRQVLLYLLGGPPAERIRVVIRNGSAPGAVRFSLTGPGTRGWAGRIRDFERLLPPASGTRLGGRNLRVSIAGRLIALMQGRTGTASDRDEEVFWLEFDLPPELPAAARAPGPPERSARAAPARLLLAEDVAINRELGRVLLERGGYHVDVVGDGDAALAAATTGRYDLVLLDMRLPGTDGFAVVREIRALAAPHCAVPVVALSADVTPEQVARCRAAGMDECLGKPFSRADLYAVIERLLSARVPVPASG
ncbi:multi-sensor hybrid histidine kinase [Methylobacterium sp. 4-46]|uniref:response regulator n=1 Tax=unclassified Methylobacterium TaxID=2615210 RepID=UPI000152D6D9|nr:MULTISPECIES: response regulator [Methylobacterium]ACA16569.1 multi-sensor hybrid histidine kinase [Methylobacterium sp. 4-46]WFT82278.1 response regulator [Methylobacterium nodulans]